MIVTRDFVLINLPKTGTTFVRTVLKEYFKNNLFKNYKFKELLLPRKQRILGQSQLISDKDQHGIVSQIPLKYKNRRKVSITRDPLTRVNSFYSFGWWKKEPPIDVNLIKEEFENFPNLTIDEYLFIYKNYIKRSLLPERYWELNIGPQTIQYIIFYSKNPLEYFEYLLVNNKKPNLKNPQYFDDILFLRMENLNNDLFDLLIGLGYSKKKLERLLDRKPINVSNSDEVELTEDQKKVIRELERPIYDLHNFYS
jgi:hypothetical protein